MVKNQLELQLEEITPNISPVDEIQKQKLELAEKFLSEGIEQKTEITKSERMILPILHILANNPFPISSSKCPKLKKFKLDILNKFLDKYYMLGIPMNRKGRKEEVEVLKSALSSNEVEMVEENGKVNKILR